ncbi:MAG: EutN/CcmL family microcompartment protein [Planctomycetales bacterium]
MRIAEVIGRVTLNQRHPSLQGATWLIAVPLTLDGLAHQGPGPGRGEPFVVYDELGAGQGARIAVSEGAEAAAPFYPQTKPIDAYNAAILDTLEFEPL